MNRIHQPSAEQLAAEEIEIQSWNSNFFGSFVCDFGLDCISIILTAYLGLIFKWGDIVICLLLYLCCTWERKY